MWKFKPDNTYGYDDYEVYLNDNYIGLISDSLQLIIYGKTYGYKNTLLKAKISFIIKYYLITLFRL